MQCGFRSSDRPTKCRTILCLTFTCKRLKILSLVTDIGEKYYFSILQLTCETMSDSHGGLITCLLTFLSPLMKDSEKARKRTKPICDLIAPIVIKWCWNANLNSFQDRAILMKVSQHPFFRRLLTSSGLEMLYTFCLIKVSKSRIL